ncbi:protein disulfide-isomerase [Diaporthe amygdali]|uniref:protein disulfide-isomerase n=1 Tax=Phomopsis amygdali TaxID=1214568 RepID=UPI0022FE5CB0|nr:protein disulfide-isomerase [Diaporthe amygdali]KAJ0125279.1 protein disulfide-isomerase [Diaporthe amygdali]
MRITSTCSLISLLGHTALAKWPTVDEAGVREAINTNEHTLVAYVLANDEPHTNLEKEWSSVQKSAEKDTVLTVDCSTRAKLCGEFNIVSFPTIRLHQKDGTFERYRGPRKAKEYVVAHLPPFQLDVLLTQVVRIKAYLQRMKRSPISVVNENNITSFATTDDVIFIAQFSEKDQYLEDRYTDMVHQYRDRYSFAVGPVAADSSSLQCINNGNQEQFSTTQLSNPASIENFIKQCTLPLVPELTRRNEAEYMRLGKSIVHYFVSADEDRDAYVADIKPLAKKFKEYLIFATTDVNQYLEMPAVMGHKAASAKVLAVSSPSNGGVYPYRGGKDLTSEVVEAFLNDISEGKVKPWDGMNAHDDGQIKHEEL